MMMLNPAHPGELIRETIEGLREETGQKYTVEEIASALGTTRKTLSAIINKHQSITPEMALKLATAFQNTTPEFWLVVQDHYDLAQARRTFSPASVRVMWQHA